MTEDKEFQTVYKCQDCDEVFEDESELEPIYECNSCGEIFTRSNSYADNHQCPQCMKFASKLGDDGCPSCGTGQCEEVEMWQDDEDEWHVKEIITFPNIRQQAAIERSVQQPSEHDFFFYSHFADSSMQDVPLPGDAHEIVCKFPDGTKISIGMMNKGGKIGLEIRQYSFGMICVYPHSSNCVIVVPEA